MIVSSVIHQTTVGLTILQKRLNYWPGQFYAGDGYDAIRHFLSDPETIGYYQGKKRVINGARIVRLKALAKTSLEHTPSDNLSFDEIKFAIDLGARIAMQLKLNKLKISAYNPKPTIVGSFNSNKG